MGRITEELLRKRAEHNDGILPDLEEVSLHQEEIEKIENLEQCCRHLKILLIQGNAIGKMENISKLKELEYLNISLNNITKVENIAGCESLKKLDMTLNFVDLDFFASSVKELKNLEFLEDLYFLGNPCYDFEGYRQYVIAHLPQLKQLDGNLITPQEFIVAQQQISYWEQVLADRALEVIAKKMADKESGYVPPETAHCVETRLGMARDMAAQKEEKEINEKRRMGTEKKEPRKIPDVMNAQGDIRQCNEGKYKFSLDSTSDRENVIFELETPKHMDTQLIDVDVNPLYVRVVCHEKLTQLKLPEEVDTTGTKVQRSKTTGFLKITMPKQSRRSSKIRRNSYGDDDDLRHQQYSKNKANPVLAEVKPLTKDEEKGPNTNTKSAISKLSSSDSQVSTTDDSSCTSDNVDSTLDSSDKENKNSSSKSTVSTEERRRMALELLNMHKDPICRDG